MAQTTMTTDVQNPTEEAPFSHMVEGNDVATTVPNTVVTNTNSAMPVQSVDAIHMVDGSAPVAELSNLAPIPMAHGLALAGILFAIGLAGVMARRNFLFMLMSLEIMMNSAALAFIVGGSRWLNADGQVMFIFILTLAAAEAAIGLAILLQFYHKRGHLDVDSANEMKG